jgi:hypothetical protein
MSDIFISYSRQDAQAAEIIRRELEDAGLEVFFDRSHITVATKWRRSIQEALQQSRAVLVLVGISGIGEFQQIEVAEAIKVCVKGKKHLAAVLLPGVHASSLSLGLLANYQWFECDREPIKRLSEQLCAQLGRTAKWGGSQFGDKISIDAPVPGGSIKPLLVFTLANTINERVAMTWQTFELGIQRLESQIEAAGRGWHPIVIGVNPVGFLIAARLQQKFFGGNPLGYYSDMPGHAAAWPSLSNNRKEDPTVLIVDSELKSGGSLVKTCTEIRTYFAKIKLKPYIRVAVFAAEVTGTRIAALVEAARSSRVCPVTTLRAWKKISALKMEALYIGCLMDGPGTRRPLELR